MRALLVLALLALVAAPAAAAPLDVAVGTEGGPPADLRVSDGGTPLEPGDDVVYAAQAVTRIDVRLDASAAPAAAALLPADSAAVDLRNAQVEHPLFVLVRDVNARLPEGLPASLYVGADGLDVGWDLGLTERHAGDHPLVYDLGLPIEASDTTLGTEPRVLDESDALLDLPAGWTCPLPRDTLAHAVLRDALCATGMQMVALQEAIPGVVLRAELQSLTVTVAEGAGTAAQTAAYGAGILGPHTALPAALAVPSPDGAEARRAPFDAALPQDERAPGGGSATDVPAMAQALGAPSPPTETAALLAAALAGLAFLALAIPLYRRIARGRVLEHGLRGQLLALVRANPGIHESAAAHRLGVAPNLVQYHVRLLAEFGIVEVRRFGGRKCLFASGQLGRAEKALVVADKGSGARVLDAIAASPGVTQRALARQLGVRESSVKWHLDRLAESGVVAVERTTQGKFVRLSEATARARTAPPTQQALAPASDAQPSQTAPIPA